MFQVKSIEENYCVEKTLLIFLRKFQKFYSKYITLVGVGQVFSRKVITNNDTF